MCTGTVRGGVRGAWGDEEHKNSDSEHEYFDVDREKPCVSRLRSNQYSSIIASVWKSVYCVNMTSRRCCVG